MATCLQLLILFLSFCYRAGDKISFNFIKIICYVILTIKLILMMQHQNVILP